MACVGWEIYDLVFHFSFIQSFLRSNSISKDTHLQHIIQAM